MKTIKHIVSITLSLSLIFSTTGINLSYHICKSGNVKEVDIALYQAQTTTDSDECPVCNTNETDHGCKMDKKSEQHDCCAVEIPENNCNTDYKILEENCCSFYSEFVQADLLSNLINNIDINLKYAIELVQINIFEINFSDIFSKIEMLKHYSGVSPPYASKYLHFIKSILI
jgi:hypothetical protein